MIFRSLKITVNKQMGGKNGGEKMVQLRVTIFHNGLINRGRENTRERKVQRSTMSYLGSLCQLPRARGPPLDNRLSLNGLG